MPLLTLPNAARLLLVMMLSFGSLSSWSQDDEAAPEANVDDSAQEDVLEEAESRTNMRELIETEKKANEVIAQKSAELAENPNLPRTPLQLMVILAEAGQDKDWERAAGFLDMRYLPEDFQWEAVDLLNALRVVWNQQNLIDITQISDEPEGKLNDGLPTYRDLLGFVRMDDGEEVPIYLQRIPDGQGGKIWKLSNASVAVLGKL